MTTPPADYVDSLGIVVSGLIQVNVDTYLDEGQQAQTYRAPINVRPISGDYAFVLEAFEPCPAWRGADR